jgi:hypothetical protein
MAKTATLKSIEIARDGNVWAHVSWGTDDEMTLPISIKAPPIDWAGAIEAAKAALAGAAKEIGSTVLK